MTTSAEIRRDLIRALRLDLVGPGPDDQDLSREILPQPPSRWYLTGFLVPYEAPAEQRLDEQGNEQLDLGLAEGGDDEDSPEPPSARKAFLPSSLGISVLIPKQARGLRVEVTWGDYGQVRVPLDEGPESKEDGPSSSEGRLQWERAPRSVSVEVPVDRVTARPATTEVEGSGGLRLVTSVRPLTTSGDASVVAQLPEGTRAVSVFLVNHRPPKVGDGQDEPFSFQARLALTLDAGFVPRPNLRGLADDDWDERVADLQYRDVYEWAVGHGVATCAHVEAEDRCRQVETTWIPTAEVERVEPAGIRDVELSMEALASIDSSTELQARMRGLVDGYRSWIAEQRRNAPLGEQRGEVVEMMLRRAGVVADRIAGGLEILEDAQVREAFRLANRVMNAAARQRASHGGALKPDQAAPPTGAPSSSPSS